MNKAQRKTKFIHQLAVYLYGKQAAKSVQLEMGVESAQEWEALRTETPLFGYLTVKEAEKQLTEFLT